MFKEKGDLILNPFNPQLGPFPFIGPCKILKVEFALGMLNTQLSQI